MVAAVYGVGNDPTLVEDKQLDDWPELDTTICHELDQLKTMKTWKLVEPPDDTNIIGSRLALHYKHDEASKITSCKAHLVAQGFSQVEGMDYNETFSLTAKLTAICIIAAIATHNNWELEQTDVDGAYLNASLGETIYMWQPKGYKVQGKEHHVCHLLWALYGLKQARREWYLHFCEAMLKLGLTHCQTVLTLHSLLLRLCSVPIKF